MTNKKVSESVPSLKSKGMKAPRPGKGEQASSEEVREDHLKSRGAKIKEKPADAMGKPKTEMAKMKPDSKPATKEKAMRGQAEWCGPVEDHPVDMKKDRHY